jgi:hypothetical protein
MPFTKTAHASLLEKVAAIEEYDRAQAFEHGLKMAAAEMELNNAEYQQMVAIVQAKLAEACGATMPEKKKEAPKAPAKAPVVAKAPAKAK